MTTVWIREWILIALDLREAHGQSRTVEDIARHVDVPASEARRHLDALRDAGMVRCSGPGGEWTVTPAGWRHTRHTRQGDGR